MPSNALPPLFANTATDRGALPVVLGYIGASITITVSAIRYGLTAKKQHELRRDDYCYLVGALLAVATSVLLERAVDDGLGRHADKLTHAQLDAYTKFTYAADLLGIVAQSAAKLSVAFLYERLAPRQDKKGIRILMSVTGVWIVFALFATAFSCDGKVYWGAQCSSGGWALFAVIVTNLTTDLVLALYMVPRIWKLQARLRDRVLPIILMGSRVLVCCLQVGQLVVLIENRLRYPFHGPDDTWTSTTLWAITMYGVCDIRGPEGGADYSRSIVHLSLITATIPRINSFIADVQTRQAGLALTQHHYESYVNSRSGGQKGSKDGSNNWSRSKNDNSRGIMGSFLRPDEIAEQRSKFSGGRDIIELDNRDNVETSSQSSLKGNAVYQKTDFKWEEEQL